MTADVALERLRREHAVIARGLADVRLVADALPELVDAQRSELVRVAVALFARFERHARDEERDLYPAVSQMLGDRRLAAAMTHDHRALKAAAAELAAVDPLDSPRLQALLYGMHTLLTAHMQKEEEIIFPMLEPPTIEGAGWPRGRSDVPRPWEAQLFDSEPVRSVLAGR